MEFDELTKKYKDFEGTEIDPIQAISVFATLLAEQSVKNKIIVEELDRRGIIINIPQAKLDECFNNELDNIIAKLLNSRKILI